MTETPDERLKSWAESVNGTATVSFAPPDEAWKGGTVGLYLLEIVQKPPERGARRPPMQLSLNYLVTAWGETPEQSNHLIAELMFSAMGNAEMEVKLDAIPAATWQALRVRPRAAFTVAVPVRRQPEDRPAKPVLKPLVVQTAPIGDMEGRVLTHDDVPLAGARVEIPALQLSTATDPTGRFYFPAVPRDPPEKVVRVMVKGRERSVVTVPDRGDGPLVIRFDPLEG